MTIEQTVFVAAATGLVVGLAAFLLMLRRVRKNLDAPRPASLTPEQLRDVNDLTEQLQRLIQDIDAKVGDYLSRLDEAMIQADAKTAQLRRDAGETPATMPATQAPPQEDVEEDEPVTLPGTWPIPPSREQTNTQTPPRDTTQLRSPRHAEVLRLHWQGSGADAIARKLQMDLGEVELVLRLHGTSAGPC